MSCKQHCRKTEPKAEPLTGPTRTSRRHHKHTNINVSHDERFFLDLQVLHMLQNGCQICRVAATLYPRKSHTVGGCPQALGMWRWVMGWQLAGCIFLGFSRVRLYMC